MFFTLPSLSCRNIRSLLGICTDVSGPVAPALYEHFISRRSWKRCAKGIFLSKAKVITVGCFSIHSCTLGCPRDGPNMNVTMCRTVADHDSPRTAPRRVHTALGEGKYEKQDASPPPLGFTATQPVPRRQGRLAQTTVRSAARPRSSACDSACGALPSSGPNLGSQGGSKAERRGIGSGGEARGHPRHFREGCLARHLGNRRGRRARRRRRRHARLVGPRRTSAVERTERRNHRRRRRCRSHRRRPLWHLRQCQQPFRCPQSPRTHAIDEGSRRRASGPSGEPTSAQEPHRTSGRALAAPRPSRRACGAAPSVPALGAPAKWPRPRRQRCPRKRRKRRRRQ
jgi:hypothetical protein